MIKTIKSMKDVKVLSKKEIMAVRGGAGKCSETQPCPDGWCCNLTSLVCEKGGPFGGCTTP